MLLHQFFSIEKKNAYIGFYKELLLIVQHYKGMYFLFQLIFSIEKKSKGLQLAKMARFFISYGTLYTASIL